MQVLDRGLWITKSTDKLLLVGEENIYKLKNWLLKKKEQTLKARTTAVENAAIVVVNVIKKIHRS